MNHKTLKQLFPEMDWRQRTKLGIHLYNLHGIKTEGKIKEKHNMVRLYNESCHELITIEAAKLFGNG